MAFERYLPKFLSEFLRERRRSRIVWQVINLRDEQRFAEAAEVYSNFAEEHSAVERTLYYGLYGEYALENWIDAGRPGKALEQARSVLRAFCRNDGEWMRYSSGDHASVLIQMATKLHAAAFLAEAETFALEVNAQLEKYSVPFRCLIDPAEKKLFPTVCGQCGGLLPYSTHQEAIKCPFCGALAYSQTPE